MKTCKFILLFVLLVSCWNYAEPELGIEEEVFLDAELNFLPENIRVMDLLAPGYLPVWDNATFTICMLLASQEVVHQKLLISFLLL